MYIKAPLVLYRNVFFLFYLFIECIFLLQKWAVLPAALGL